MAQCARIKASGERCKGTAMPGAEWCYSHHPDYQEQRRINASRGGKSGGRGRAGSSVPLEIAEAKRSIRDVIEGVRGGDLERSVGAVVFQGYNCLLKAVETERKILEQEELIRRLEALEETQAKEEPTIGGGRRWGV
jgi:hypothetical protein